MRDVLDGYLRPKQPERIGIRWTVVLEGRHWRGELWALPAGYQARVEHDSTAAFSQSYSTLGQAEAGLQRALADLRSRGAAIVSEQPS